MHDADTQIDASNIPLYRRGVKGGAATPLYVFGYVPTNEELLAYADNHNIQLDEPEPERRISSARCAILGSLPMNLAMRSALVPVKHESETHGACLVIATNLSEKELSHATSKVVISRLKKAFETREEPKWYRLERRDFLSLS